MGPDGTLSHILAAPILVEETAGRERCGERIRVGVPFARGVVRDAVEIVVGNDAVLLPSQCRRLASWPDGSVKWALVDALVSLAPRGTASLTVAPRHCMSAMRPRALPPRVTVERHDHGFIVDTGPARFWLRRGGSVPFVEVSREAARMLSTAASRIRIRANGIEYDAVAERVHASDTGPVSATIVMQGRFERGRRSLPLEFVARCTFVAGSRGVTVSFRLRNPRAARHVGGLWDLGDAGSCRIDDLSLFLAPSGAPRAVHWYAEDPKVTQCTEAAQFVIYQDSSGGDNWDSPNHVDAEAKPTVSFPGYRVMGGTRAEQRVLQEGRRASPCLTVASTSGWIAGTVCDFWQNFPKALRWQDGVLGVGMFPGECAAGFELQGGEQKRHVVLLEFGLANETLSIPAMQAPLSVKLDASWVEQTGALPWFAACSEHDDVRLARYVKAGIDGADSFFAKREVVDEYGWRNFGDLYADHEAVHHRGAKPLVAHFNNQYDFVDGALVQFLRTGDDRWRRLMDDAARHTIDIDVYHTQEDRAAYNGGLFWHTDHYKEAGTCTHRTYSRRNGGRGYGGGPCNEHNYTTGLLHYHYLTGDDDAAEVVLSLADWVLAMDAPSRVLRGLGVASTGLATCTTRTDYQGPGRGAGNSINALLDAFALTRQQPYLEAAEAFVTRCIHPADDVAKLGLDAPEERWSYLVFLQALGKYLAQKAELGAFDERFRYARASLLHYAGWMLDHEVPYKDILHKVLIPTETWPAHDIRKCHVLNVAATHATGPQRAALRRKAAYFFDRCLDDLLSFDTAAFTRPRVILTVYGDVQAYFAKQADLAPIHAASAHRFARSEAFVPARRPARALHKALAAGAEAGRRGRYAWFDFKTRLGFGS
jgi:hypothetical protein